jgi:methionyl-tRNA formyltransferase
MKLIFAGTPVFAAAALDALHNAGHEIALVLTQPDRPAGRGLQPLTSAVKRLAQERELQLAQPAKLRDGPTVEDIKSIAPDAMVVAAYGLLLPSELLSVPPRGCINIHASLLPRWRGAAPIQRAILAGDKETGITIMQMDAGLDTGAILLQEALPIATDDTAQTLHDRLAALGGRLIVRALDEAQTPHAQNDALATYAAKLDKREAEIDWDEPADVIERKIRAFNPAPGAAANCRGVGIKVWRAKATGGAAAPPGTVMAATKDRIRVACGHDSALDIFELQRAGGRRLPVGAFLSGFDVQPGERFTRT